MYQEISEALNEAQNDPNILICVVTGNGTYYSAGNDLTNYTNAASTSGENPNEAIERGTAVVEYVYNSSSSQFQMCYL